MQWVVEGLRGESVRRDHGRDRGGLHRDLDVVEIDFIEVREFQTRRLDQGFGGGAAEAFVDVGVQAAGVHADAYRYAAVTRLRGHQLDLFGFAQVAGIEAQPLDAGLEGGERHLDVEVDVRDDGHRRTRHDLGQTLGCRHFVAGAAHDVGAFGRQGVDLLERAFHVGRFRRRHRLDGDGRVAADLYGTDGNLAGLSAGAEGASGDVHSSSLPVRSRSDAVNGRDWRSGGRCPERAWWRTGPAAHP